MTRHKIMPLLAAFFACGVRLFMPATGKADCRDPELRRKVAETAKAEGVNENELLSIIAHESGCHYYAVAWNLPRRPETAKSKFLNSQIEAKILAQALIVTGLFRVDVGIGQINNEAHIRPKGWSLDEILNPDTALSRVARVLKERGWRNYHSSNPVLAEKWQKKAKMALNEALLGSPKLNLVRQNKSGPLLVFGAKTEGAVCF